MRANNLTGVTDVEVFIGSSLASQYPDSDGDHDNGLATRRWDRTYSDNLTLGANQCDIEVVTSAPSGGCTTCDVRLRTTGGAGSTMYVCEAGSWAAK